MSRVAAAAVAAMCAVAACGHNQTSARVTATATPLAVPSPSDRLVALLPDGAQIVAEIDLARLRANPVIGETVRRALDDISAAQDVDLPMKLPVSPLGATDTVVLAAYGVGTTEAATITLLATARDVPGARRVADGIVALGPEAWLDQVDARAAIVARTHAGPSDELIKLRDHSLPTGATGAAIRLSARLSFDARISLARQTGIELAPAQLSLWGDVADDLAIVVDADAGTETPSKLAAIVRNALDSLADAPALRALGLPNSLRSARQVRQGTWIRTVLAIGPAQLKRVVVRANVLLGPAVAPASPAAGSAS